MGCLGKGGLREFCDWVKARSPLFRGVCFGTMLRDDAFNFVRLGTCIERADNTARLFDVKYIYCCLITKRCAERWIITNGVWYYARYQLFRRIKKYLEIP